jgi:tetratricopeptide (TPR) repeat protein
MPMPAPPGPAIPLAGQGTRREGARGQSSSRPRLPGGARARRMVASIAAIATLAALAVIALTRGARRRTDPGHPATSDAGATEIVAVTDVPIPLTTPAAAADFAAALRIFRDGNTPGAMARLAHALTLEPKLGEAYVQRALMMAADGPVGARADYLHAIELTDGLDARDAAILKGLGPCVLTEPTDFHACTAALLPLQAQYPRDAEIAFFVASIESMAGDVDISTRLFRDALRLDPKFGFAWARVGQDEAYLGQFDEARRSFAECLSVVPTSTFCRMNRLWVSDQEGELAACETDARALTVTASQEVAYLEVFPQAVAAQGRPREAVEDALKPALAKWADVKHYRDGQTLASLDILDGRFDVARASLEALQERFAAYRDPWRWLYLTRSLFTLLEEVGDLESARRLADNLTARLSVLPTNQGAEDWAIAQDPVPLLYEARFRAHALTRVERDAKRDAWVAAWRERTTPAYYGYLWIQAYATDASSPDEAIEAMRALGDLGGAIPLYRPQTATNFDIGRTLLLAGEVDRALPFLRKATRSCLPLDFPFPFVRAQLWLGEALARSGDTAGACDALRTVTARWGNARPRSVTATAARARARDLGCP